MAKKIAGSDKKADDGTRSWELQLYVAGDNINGKIALTQIKKICITHLFKNCHIKVIDLRKNPEIALEEHIVALPMLVRTYPEPKKILVGDLTNVEKVLRCLEIK
jgi:circadian clock protein KaiB